MEALPLDHSVLGLADGLDVEGGTGRWHVSSRLWLKHGVQFPEVAEHEEGDA